jgi:hypothetical protein
MILHYHFSVFQKRASNFVDCSTYVDDKLLVTENLAHYFVCSVMDIAELKNGFLTRFRLYFAVVLHIDVVESTSMR